MDASKEAVTKIEAAMRQLDTAIWPFFADGDPISIRTLAAASTTLFADLIEAKAPGESWRSQIVSDTGLPRGTALAIINSTSNFFKHADRDPESTILFNHEENDDLLFVGVLECGEIQATTLYMQAFQIWYLAKYPSRFNISTPQIDLAQKVFPGLHHVNRAESIARGAKFIAEVQNDGKQAFAA